jgi:flagellar biosynthesis protein FlhF
LASEIAARMETSGNLEELWGAALAELANRIPIKQDGANILDHGGVVAVVGATGVGKTTTVAKLAAHFALRHGRDQVGLISTDCFRVGGQEQLDTFGRVVGVPVLVATNRDKMMLAISQLSSRKLILIDTAGMSQRDLGLSEQLAAFSGPGSRGIQTYLTLSATAQSTITDEVIRAFSIIELAGVIITKTDEAGSLGALISALIRHQLPAAYIGHGQCVPEDIRTACGEDLVATARSLMEQFGWDQTRPSPLSRAGSSNG